MVFGTTYCAISHLPINDGDKCMLLPLGFNMKNDFDKWNKASINSFMFLYCFIYEPQEVIYNGNPDSITYLNKNYENCLEYELYMLIHFDFYNSIINEFNYFGLDFINSLNNFRTIEPIWNKAIEYQNKQLQKKEQYPIATPIWIKNIYKIALFIDNLGIIPYPNRTVKQTSDIIELYEKIRANFIVKFN